MERRKVKLRHYRWRPTALTWAITFLALGGLVAALYPMTAGWLSSYNQSQVIETALANIADIRPEPKAQLDNAKKYNEALTSGVKLESGGNVPVGTGNLAGIDLNYKEMLVANDEGLMGRIKIPGIHVDLPIYHGTSDTTLLKGAGHLEGSHLPVGGEGTRSVITAHRGLANSTMFTNLNQVNNEDTFTVETLGEVLTYQVFDIQVIEPTETSSLRAQPGRDLVTLITCTPLGINSQRIVVTGERITPTPSEAVSAAGQAPLVPGFPWWVVIAGLSVLLIVTYALRQGNLDARAANKRNESLGTSNVTKA